MKVSGSSGLGLELSSLGEGVRVTSTVSSLASSIASDFELSLGDTISLAKKLEKEDGDFGMLFADVMAIEGGLDSFSGTIL